jgi:hypothetical protein
VWALCVLCVCVWEGGGAGMVPPSNGMIPSSQHPWPWGEGGHGRPHHD